MSARVLASIAACTFAGCDSGRPDAPAAAHAGSSAPIADASIGSGSGSGSGSAAPDAREADAEATVCSAPAVDPYVDALPRMRAFERGSEVDRQDLHDANLFDLDADGHTDFAITSREWCGTGGCPYWLYLWRAGCGTYVGRIEGKELDFTKRGAHGLVDITSTWWLGCCSKVEKVARFDGKRYRVTERDCDYKSGDSGERTWVCGRWHGEGDKR
jgi:hypothetical protein